MIVRFIIEQGTINSWADANWSFVPFEGTSVVFETGPRAKDHLADVKSEPAGEGAASFARYGITL